jgi:hypothetical protein
MTSPQNGHQFNGQLDLPPPASSELVRYEQPPLVPIEHPPARPGLGQRIYARLPEIVNEPQPSVAQLIRRARTPEDDSPEPPVWLLAWTYAVAIPVQAIGMAVAWTARHPARTAVAVVLLLLLGTALARSEFAVLVPSWLDLTTWW